MLGSQLRNKVNEDGQDGERRKCAINWVFIEGRPGVNERKSRYEPKQLGDIAKTTELTIRRILPAC